MGRTMVSYTQEIYILYLTHTYTVHTYYIQYVYVFIDIIIELHFQQIS